ncbi:MAG TPA: hypothetical protein V6C58_26165 [Allocoleopsis sp.]
MHWYLALQIQSDIFSGNVDQTLEKYGLLHKPTTRDRQAIKRRSTRT